MPRRFIFRHPLVRRGVYESIGGGSRLASHARAAESLAARGAAAADRAHHVEQAASQGDAEAIEVLLEAAEAASARAPAVAARWLEGALRLLLDGDHERQISVRVALASALRSIGELERCREVLLETIGLVGDGDEPRRLQLTGWCAAVEHWLGEHEAAHKRLLSAWDELGDHATAESTALQIELAVDGLYSLDFEQTFSMGAGALANARALDEPALTAHAAAALCLGEVSAGNIGPAREHYEEAVGLVDRLADEALAPHLDAFYYLAWAENYLEHYDASLAHIDRGIEIARGTGQGRLLIPLMLTKGYPLELQGRLTEAAEVCEAAVEAARLSGNDHYLFWALAELAWPHYFAGELSEAIEACEESLSHSPRLTGGTIPASGGGPGWALAVALFISGEVERGYEAMQALGSAEIEFAVPIERCFDWETLALAELAVGNVEAAEAHAQRAEELAASLDGLQLPLGLAGRARAAVLLHKGEAEAAIAPARIGVEGAAGRRRRPAGGLRAPAAGPGAGGERRARGGDRGAARGRAGARRLRLPARARRRAPRAAQARGAARGARSGSRRERGRLADQARVRDRRPGHRPPHQQRDRRRAVPQREDDRVPPAQHLLQARRLLPGRRRPHFRARAAWLAPTRPAWPSSATARS